MKFATKNEMNEKTRLLIESYENYIRDNIDKIETCNELDKYIYNGLENDPVNFTTALKNVMITIDKDPKIVEGRITFLFELNKFWRVWEQVIPKVGNTINEDVIKDNIIKQIKLVRSCKCDENSDYNSRCRQMIAQCVYRSIMYKIDQLSENLQSELMKEITEIMK